MLLDLVAYVIHLRQLVPMSQVMVVLQVQHDFVQNVIVLRKPMRSNRLKINILFMTYDSLLFSSPRRNKYHPYSAPINLDENANDQFRDENPKYRKINFC